VSPSHICFSIQIDKLRVHLKYFCGEGAERTEAQSRQRRNRDQGTGSGTRGGGSGSSKGSKKKSFSSKKAPPKAKAKKVIRVKSSKEYDSESDLSVASDDGEVVTGTPTHRRSRAAAVSAKKQLSNSKAEWATKTTDTDSDDYSGDEVSSDEDSSEEESTPRGRGTKQPARKKVKQINKSDLSSESDDDSDSDDEEDLRIQRAREKQAEALALAKSSKGNKPASKNNPPKTGKGGKKKAAAGKKRKNFDGDSSSSSEDDDRDPMEGIDMDRLIEEAMEGSQMSVLHSVCWWRIILDEAHCIKSRSSGTANAAFSLIGIHRWCLSGTPLQNRVGELYSLIRFLRIDPMAHYFCRAKVSLVWQGA